MKRQRHEHSGYSSQGSFDPLKAFRLMDLSLEETMLDAGCGTGYMSMIASRIVGENGRIISMDIDPQAVDILEKRMDFGGFHNIEAEVWDLTEPLEKENMELDMVLFANVFHGFILNGETDTVLHNVDRYLKRDGKVSIIEHRKEESETGPPVEDRFSSDEIGKVFQDIGMGIADQFDLSDTHYLVIIGRV